MSRSSRGRRARIITTASLAVALITGAGFLLTRRRIDPVPPPLPCKINLVLDTSASMQGYFNGQTQLKNTLSRLVPALDKLPKTNGCSPSITYQFASSSGTLLSTRLDSAGFVTRLLNDDLKGQDSLLQEMFRHVVAESSGTPTSEAHESGKPESEPVIDSKPPEENVSDAQKPGEPTLSILVTDSIFSYPDEDVKANPNINKDNIEALASSVQLIFNDAHKASKAVSVLAFRSQFNGTYFNYRNGKTACCSSLRPYYMWLIGSPDNVRAIRSYLARENILPDHAVDFGQMISFNPELLRYDLRRQMLYRHNDVDPKRINLAKSFPNTGSLRFAIGLDLSMLSNDQSAPAFLAQHLKVHSDDLQIESQAIRTRAELQPMDPEDRDEWSNFTHALIITTDAKFSGNAKISISFEDALPSWCLAWSNDDDAGVDARKLDTTFGLNYFMEGIAQAYRNQNSIPVTTVLLQR